MDHWKKHLDNCKQILTFLKNEFSKIRQAVNLIYEFLLFFCSRTIVNHNSLHVV